MGVFEAEFVKHAAFDADRGCHECTCKAIESAVYAVDGCKSLIETLSGDSYAVGIVKLPEEVVGR